MTTTTTATAVKTALAATELYEAALQIETSLMELIGTSVVNRKAQRDALDALASGLAAARENLDFIAQATETIVSSIAREYNGLREYRTVMAWNEATS